MIIGQVEKRSWKVKVLNICIHLLLILGSATMVYPLLLMLSGSFKSNVDFQNFTLIPRYLHDDEELFRKYIFTKYNSRINEAFLTYKDPTVNRTAIKEAIKNGSTIEGASIRKNLNIQIK